MSVKWITNLKNNPASWVLGGIAVLLVIVISLPRAAYPEVSPARLEDDPYLGNPEAPVVLIEFGDYACEPCQMWQRAGIREQLLAEFPTQVKFIWRDNARISTASILAAEAGQCAHNQGRFWEYHDLLFEQTAGLGEPSLKAYAQQIGLDMQAFNRCLDEREMRRKVSYDMRRAGEFGFSMTPAFRLNDESIIGPPPIEYLRQQIVEQLARQQK
ncbi:MAG: thioredoxin domain-containing protein [Chloroflexota bacterium]